MYKKRVVVKELVEVCEALKETMGQDDLARLHLGPLAELIMNCSIGHLIFGECGVRVEWDHWAGKINIVVED